AGAAGRADPHFRLGRGGPAALVGALDRRPGRNGTDAPGKWSGNRRDDLQVDGPPHTQSRESQAATRRTPTTDSRSRGRPQGTLGGVAAHGRVVNIRKLKSSAPYTE